MFGKVAACGIVLVAGVASAQVRTNEIAPGRVKELTRMQDSPPPTVVQLPPEPTNTGPNPYPVETVYPYVGYYPYGYGYGYWGYPYYRYPYQQPVRVNQSQVVNVSPQAPATLAPKPLTELDYALEAMREKRTSVSIDHFIEYLRDHGDDFAALRLSALMYLEEKQPSEAATRIAMAYKRMPELARRPIDAASLGIDPARLRELVLKASKYAQRMKTGSGWLMMAVLTQAEGRTDVAIASLKKAANAGLDPDIVSTLSAQLSPGEDEQVPAADMKIQTPTTPAPPPVQTPSTAPAASSDSGTPKTR